MRWIWGATGVVVGAAYAWCVCRALAGRHFRYPDEASLARRELGPLVVAGSSALAGFLAWRGSGHGIGVVLALAVLAVCVPLAYVDLDVLRLPDRWLLPAIPAAVALAAAIATATGDWSRVVRVAWVVPATFLAFCVLYLGGGGTGLGFGDVKLAALLAVPTGWLSGWHTLAGFLLAFILGGLATGVLLLARVIGRKTPVPFGPFLMIGALGVVGLF